MPIYTYKCNRCDRISEDLVMYSARDAPRFCKQLQDDEGICGGLLVRGLDCPTIGKPEHQTAAILDSGAKIKGHFGKEAKRKRKQ
jgi:hypothetical protein